MHMLIVHILKKFKQSKSFEDHCLSLWVWVSAYQR